MRPAQAVPRTFTGSVENCVPARHPRSTIPRAVNPLFAAVLAVASATAQSSPAASFSLKDFRAGMSLGELRDKYPYRPSGDKPTDPAFPSGVRCSDDDPIFATPLHLAAARLKAGLVDCFLITTHSASPGQMPITIGNVPLREMRLWFLDGKLYKLAATFAHADTDALRSAIEGKYGRPKVSITREVQNRLGARFNAHDFVWSNGKETLAIREFFSDVETSVILLVDEVREKEATTKAPQRDSDI